jgi:hypothetical protein
VRWSWESSLSDGEERDHAEGGDRQEVERGEVAGHGVYLSVCISNGSDAEQGDGQEGGKAEEGSAGQRDLHVDILSVL